jgi:3-oxoacyl-[acyl-carrier protein] reductase
MKDLRGRVAIVTGGAAGVGLGIAEALAADGATVVIVDRDRRAAERGRAQLAGRGGEAFAAVADVLDRAALDAVVAEAVDRHGRLDVLAANAGIYPQAPLETMTEAEWDLVMDVNVKGALLSLQACVPAMRASGFGRVVLTSSITGPLVGAPTLAHYAASKAALLGLMRSAALQLARDGITVNAVLPGNVRTPGIEEFGEEFIQGMVDAIPLGRLAEPADVGWAVRFLASEEAAYITGQTVVVDGGQVLPEGPL